MRLEGQPLQKITENCKVMYMETLEKRPPLFSNKALVKITIPVMLNALTAIFMGAIDSVMVSSAGESAVSAVSLVDAINIVFLTFVNCIASGGSVVTAQYIGSRDFARGKICIRQILYVGLFLSTFIAVFLLCLNKQVLQLVYSDLEPEVFEQAQTYFILTVIGFPLSYIGSVCTTSLTAMARNAESAVITSSTYVINIAGNALLIYVFDMGVAGAAIATTFGRVVFAALGLLSMHRKNLPIYFEKILRFDLHWDIMRRALRVGITNGIENALFNIGRVLVSGLVASFGTMYIAVHSVTNTIGNIGWTIVGSFGTVLLTVVGQCIGADEREQAMRYSKKLLNVSSVILVVLFGLIFLLRHQLVRLFDFEPETLKICGYYLGSSAVLTIIAYYSMAFTPCMGFRAAGDVRFPLLLSISTMFIFRVGLSYLLCKGFGMGLTGVWLGMGADWACRSILNSIHLYRGKWLHKKLI